MKDKIKLKDAVEKILNKDPRAREKDCKWLTICVLREMGFDIYIDYSRLHEMPSFDSISRCKRLVHHSEKFNSFVPEEGITYEQPIKNENQIKS